MTINSTIWTKILKLTDDMLHCVHMGNWDELSSLEIQRKEAMQLFFEYIPETVCKRELANSIQDVLTKDEEIITYVNKHMAQIMQDSSELNYAKTAVAQYQMNL